MDAFYASVEQRDNPALRGQPVAVGGEPDKRGVVAAASYEARKFGVRSAIPMSRAVRLCPSLVIVRPDFTKYRTVSQQVFAIFRERHAARRTAVAGRGVSRRDRERLGRAAGDDRRAPAEGTTIREQTGLTASAGVAPNKFLAKIASGWQKPDGLTVIAPERVERFLQGLPVDALWGVGPVTAREAARARHRQARRRPRRRSRDASRDRRQSLAEWLQQLAQGIDDRPVVPNTSRKSSGSENTFDQRPDRTSTTSATTSRAMARDAAAWLRKRALFARTVTIKVRYDDFTTITRSHTDGAHARRRGDRPPGGALLDKTEAGQRPVRLLGVSVSNLCAAIEPVLGKEPKLPFGGTVNSECEIRNGDSRFTISFAPP